MTHSASPVQQLSILAVTSSWPRIPGSEQGGWEGSRTHPGAHQPPSAEWGLQASPAAGKAPHRVCSLAPT